MCEVYVIERYGCEAASALSRVESTSKKLQEDMWRGWRTMMSKTFQLLLRQLGQRRSQFMDLSTYHVPCFRDDLM